RGGGGSLVGGGGGTSRSGSGRGGASVSAARVVTPAACGRAEGLPAARAVTPWRSARGRALRGGGGCSSAAGRDFPPGWKSAPHFGHQGGGAVVQSTGCPHLLQ